MSVNGSARHALHENGLHKQICVCTIIMYIIQKQETLFVLVLQIHYDKLDGNLSL